MIFWFGRRVGSPVDVNDLEKHTSSFNVKDGDSRFSKILASTGEFTRRQNSEDHNSQSCEDLKSHKTYFH